MAAVMCLVLCTQTLYHLTYITLNPSHAVLVAYGGVEMPWLEKNN